MLYSLIFAMLSMFCFVTPAWSKPDHQFSSEEIAVIKEAAGKGGIKAQALLGTLYYYGNGVPEDEIKAVQWWRKSAEQGSPFAQYDLAMAYHDGIGGLPKSNKKAVEWFAKGAKAGEVRSQYNLGIAYYHALGVKKNKAEAPLIRIMPTRNIFLPPDIKTGLVVCLKISYWHMCGSAVPKPMAT